MNSKIQINIDDMQHSFNTSNFNIYLLCIAGVLFGCIDELWLRMIPGRFSSHYDIIADGIGVICGVSIGQIIFKKRL